MIRLKATQIHLSREEALTSLVNMPMYQDYLHNQVLVEHQPVPMEVPISPESYPSSEGGESEADTVVHLSSSRAILRASSPDGENLGVNATPRIRVYNINTAQGTQDGNEDSDEAEEEGDEIEPGEGGHEEEAEEGEIEDWNAYESSVEDEVELVQHLPRARHIESMNYSLAEVQASSPPRSVLLEENPYASLMEMVNAAHPSNVSPRTPRRRFFIDDSDDDEFPREVTPRTIPATVSSGSAPNTPGSSGGDTRHNRTPARELFVFEDLDPEAVSSSRSRFRLRLHSLRNRRAGARSTPEMENHDLVAEEEEAFEAALGATGPDGELLITPPRRLPHRR